MKSRFLLLSLFFIFIYGSLAAKLYTLQVKKGFYYFEQAQARSEMLNQSEFRRGQIFFTDRYEKQIPVVLNRDYPVLYAVPKEIGDVNYAASLLAPITGLTENYLSESLSNPESLYRLISEKVSDEDISKINNLKIKGIYFDKKQYRFYPFEKLASQLLGFVGVNEENERPVGLYGAEKFYNALLSGGNDLNLTIDRIIQAQSEETLQNLIGKFSAAGGTIIVQNPKTGEIIALANKEDFDPNDYKNYPVGNFLNPAVQYIYEPGSVFKPITMAAGIESGAFAPETTFYDKGSVTLNGKTITNWDGKAHGKITMTNVIEQSVNTGAVFAEQKIGNDVFLEYLKKFGFGELAGIDLPNEAAGSLRNLENKNARAIDFATASFGQGTAVTPLQIINAFSSIANGGLLMRPYVNADLDPYVIRRVISSETSLKVTKMMESAVTKAGVASIYKYQVAGKTGTAQVPNFKTGGYTEEFIHTFIGFAPASDARFVILIKIDKPKATLAGQTVVPAFKNLTQFVLNYYNLSPDEIDATKNNQ